MIPDRNDTVFYVFGSRATPWANESAPPSANLTIYATENDIKQDLLFGKRATANDMVFVIPRRTWAANTVYVNYDTQNTNTSSPFYVITSNNHVFKVIDNNNGANSTVEPFVVDTKIFELSDGYKWKYLYTISNTDMNKWGTASFIPVTPNTNITSASIPGTIEHIDVVAGGNGYTTYHVGNVVSVTNSTSFTISANASSVDNFYTNSSIFFNVGYGTGQVSKITSYIGSSKQVTLESPVEIKTQIFLSNGATGSFAIGNRVYQEHLIADTANVRGTAISGDTFVLYDDTNYANGVIVEVSNSGITFNRVDGANSATYSTSRPWRIGSGVTNPGTITVANATTSNVTGSSTDFTINLAVGDYIRANNRVRRIVSIANNTQITTDIPFGQALTAVSYIRETTAGYFTNVVSRTASGIIEQADLNSKEVFVQSTTGTFIPGEFVSQSNSTGLIAGGYLISANADVLYLSNTVGSFATNVILVGGVSAAQSTPKWQSGQGSTPAVRGYDRLLINAVSGTWFVANIQSHNAANTQVGTARIGQVFNQIGSQTGYVISPYINIVGDGVGAKAYATVNTLTGTISSVDVVNYGNNYTFATATVEANTSFGQNASLRVRLSPPQGSGANVANELYASKKCISVTFANGQNEGYYFPTRGSYRQYGLIKDPKFANVAITIGAFQRQKITIASVSGSFTNNEIVYQPNTGAAGVIVFANSTLLEIDRVSGTFIANTANDNIRGLSSATTANAKIVTTSQFSVTSNSQVLRQDHTNASAYMIGANSTVALITNTQGVFTNSTNLTTDEIDRQFRGVVYDESINAYATVANVVINRFNSSFDFTRFNQLGRISLSTNTGNFSNGELVTQATTNANGYVFDTSEKDLQITSLSGGFVVGDLVTQSATSANGIVIGSNSTYLKLTNVQGAFNVGNTIATIGGSGSTANVANLYSVVVLYNVGGRFQLGSAVTGATSNAVGTPTLANTIIDPDLVKGSGEVIYIQNSTAITRTANNQEQIKIIVNTTG